MRNDTESAQEGGSSRKPLLSWIIAGGAAVVVFVLCFLAINYVGQPDDADEAPKVAPGTVATEASNAPLMDIARRQGWVEAGATELTTEQAAAVKALGDAFHGSPLEHFDEFVAFVGLEQIEAGAFEGSENLKSITIPPSVFDIQPGALAGCPALETIKVDEANTHYDSRSDCNAIICTWKGKLMVVAGCKTTAIPSAVRHIAAQTFKGCTGLETVKFPDQMVDIGAEAFEGCTALKEVALPKGIDYVRPGTFRGCTALKRVELPKTVDKLQEGAFGGCTSLATIVCPKKFPPKIDKAFSEYKATVYVPKGELNTYYVAPHWRDFPTFKELE